MTDPVDLNVERNKRTAPDAEFVKQDAFGRQMQLYALTYTMDGEDWTANVWAYSFDDASKRVEAMRATLVLDGQLMRSEPWNGII